MLMQSLSKLKSEFNLLLPCADSVQVINQVVQIFHSAFGELLRKSTRV